MSEENPEKLKEKIRSFASAIGISKIGFAKARAMEEYLPRLIDRRNTKYKYSINEGKPDKRINPNRHLPDARTVICTAIAYSCSENVPEKPMGRLSFISRGLDYHIIMEEKLNQLKEFIKGEVPDAKAVILVDKGEILEKALAVEAGLGWFGRNTLLTTPEFGSFVFLGELITNIYVPPDEPLGHCCFGCNKCLAACPTRALEAAGKLNPDRCIAGISQFKGIIPEELRYFMGNTIYGCDICQVVCPHNNPDQINYGRSDTEMDVLSCVPLDLILGLSNAEFKNLFGKTAGGWRGRTVFQRNAAVAAGNLKDTEAVPPLIKILSQDSRYILRHAAAWALGEIKDPEGSAALLKAALTEQDPIVKEEIQKSIEKIKKKECL